jgi:hypothetical protein
MTISDLVYYQIFFELDKSPEAYWTIAWICFGGFLLTSLYPYEPGIRGRSWNRPWLYVATFGLATIAFRWPVMAALGEFNPDESQLLAGAITSWHRQAAGSVDVGYCGLWAFLPLTLPALCGAPMDYLGGRCVALLMSGSAVALLWLTLCRILHDRLARLLVLPMASFFALTTAEEFVRYSGEQSAQFYFALALWLLAPVFVSGAGSIGRLRLLLGGVILGGMPFSKLQVAPLGALLGGVTLLLILSSTRRGWPERIRDAAWLIGGVLLSVGLTLGIIAASGSLFHFYKSYLVTGLAYTGVRAFANAEFVPWVWHLSQTSRGFAPFLGAGVAAILVSLPFCRHQSAMPRAMLLLGGLLLLGGIFVVWAPGRPSSHYLLFLVVPVSFMLAVLYGVRLTTSGQSRTSHLAWLLFFLGLTVGPQIFSRVQYGMPAQIGSLRLGRNHGPGAVARFLQPLTRPGDALTVWGWASRFHVETQLPQGTRESHTERQIVVGPEQEYFRARFLENLAQERPAFFLDAVGKTAFRFTDRNVYAHDRWSELQVVVNTHYQQVGEQENVRIFLRHDRVAEQAAELQRLAAAGLR